MLTLTANLKDIEIYEISSAPYDNDVPLDFKSIKSSLYNRKNTWMYLFYNFQYHQDQRNKKIYRSAKKKKNLTMQSEIIQKRILRLLFGRS